MKSKYLFLGVAIAFVFINSSWQSSNKTLTIRFGEFIDSRDNHKYKTVKIGSQEWLAENFAYLPYICSPDSANCGIWVYNYKGTNISEAKGTPEYKKFGGLYS